MAHSFVEAHDDEVAAFEHFAAAFPRGTVLLIDTYDTERGARKVVSLASQLKSRGIGLKGVRLDSGDLATLAREVRRILDEGGLTDATIFASGNLDEYRLRDLLITGAPIDGFGIGTSLVTSSDAPYLDGVYKLQEYAGKPRRKRSAGKATWPGRKQVFRQYDGEDAFAYDIIAAEGCANPGDPLLIPVMRNGRRLHAPEALDALRRRAGDQLARLPLHLKTLEPTEKPYRVEIHSSLRKLANEADRIASEVPALCK